METIVCDIARNRLKKDFNTALKDLGLFVKSIEFEENEGLYVVVEIASNEHVLEFTALVSGS